VGINATLIGQMITFALLVWFTMKFVWPPLTAAMKERQHKIAEGLAAAERGVHEKVLAENKATEILKEAKAQSSEILGRAEKRSSEIVDEAKGEAREEGERILAHARSEVEQEMNKAREALRAEVAVLAVAGAEQILAKEVDAAAHSDLLNNLARQL
jgi:F-type H+-transporting ATPase subunit b|tara:strand:- start:1962 stop:2432 length:471 start_codon:yes stop_codon:yes gene_type:complete